MNIKDLVFSLSIAFGISWLISYFIVPKFVTPPSSHQPLAQVRPLNREIDFLDESTQEEHITPVQTSYGTFSFSSWGAVLSDASFHRTVDGSSIDLTTLTHPTEVEKERGCFLLAFDSRTPFYYKMTEKTETPDSIVLTYEATSPDAKVVKRYTVHKKLHKIDLQLRIDPSVTAIVEPRLMLTGPVLVESTKAEHAAAIVDEYRRPVKYPLNQYQQEFKTKSWDQPTIFGAEDRYFLHALVSDEKSFAQRGFFKVEGGRLYPIIEGPSVKKSMTWNLSFYVGPKEYESLVAVDQRLEDVLAYGWLGFLAKPMLWFMKWMNQYLHNFGLVILLFTLLIRLLMVPLTLSGQRQAEKMQELQRKVAYLKQKHGDDREAFEREQLELYQKYGLTGMGGGCLPILIQFPIFFAMNAVLSSSIELYKAPFLWIADLSAKDPYYVLPFLVFLTMFVAAAQQSGKATFAQKASGLVMAVVFGALSIGFSAGLSLYFAASTLLGVVQTVIQKAIGL